MFFVLLLKQNLIMKILAYFETIVKEIKAIDLCFKHKYNVENTLKTVKEKKIPKEGIINGGEYYFHGIGCRVIYKNKIINFDYSPSGDVGGVGLYDLINYLKSIGHNFDKDFIEFELKKLVNENKLLYPSTSPNKSLYYLNSGNLQMSW